MSDQTLKNSVHDTTNLQVPPLRQLLHANEQHAGAGRSLTARTELALKISDRGGLGLQLIGRAPLFDGTRLIQAPSSVWGLMNLSDDPLWQSGRYPVPSRVLRRLQRYHYAGIEFDLLYAAHELPLDKWHTGEPISLDSLLPPAPRTEQKISQGLGIATYAILTTLLMPFKMAGIAAATVNTIATYSLNDPVLLGVLIPSERGPEPGVSGMWFVLGAWVW